MTLTPEGDYFHLYHSLLSLPASQSIQLSMDSIINTISQRIEQGSLIIAEEETNIVLARDRVPQDQEGYKEKLTSIKKQKLEIIRKLQKISQEQLRVREIREVNVRKERSELTEEDRVTLKRLNRAQKEFEKELEKKDEMVRSRLLSIKEREEEVQKSIKSKRHEERTQETRSKIEEIRIRSDERRVQNQQSNKLLQELKREKSLFKEMEQRRVMQEQEDQERIISLKAEIKESKMVSFDSVKEHERRYQELRERQRGEREEKIREIMLMEKKVKEWLPSESSVYKNMRFYDENESRETEFKNALPKINIDRRKEYANMVKERIFPAMKVDPAKVVEEENPLRSLSTNELYKQGTQYMREVKKLLSKGKGKEKGKSKGKQGDTHSSLAPSVSSTHSDYLREQRGKNRKGKDEIQQLASMVEGGELGSEEREKARQWMESLEMRSENDQEKLVALMNVKLTMLKNLR